MDRFLFKKHVVGTDILFSIDQVLVSLQRSLIVRAEEGRCGTRFQRPHPSVDITRTW